MLKSMIKTLALSALLLFALSCGSSDPASPNADLNAIMASKEQLDGCNNTTYTAPTQAQITAIENACTTGELSKLRIYDACFATAFCAKNIAGMTACGSSPTLSASCNATLSGSSASNSHGNEI